MNHSADVSQRVAELLHALFPSMPRAALSPDARITQDDRVVDLADTMLARVTRVGGYRIDGRDDSEGQWGYCGQLWFGDEAAVCGARVKLANGMIAEAELIRSPGRFPGSSGVDARGLTQARAAFATDVPPERRLSRQRLIDIASGYYAAVNEARPELAALEAAGARIEAGTRITGNPAFRFDFYKGLDGQDLPNFGEWTAQQQFERGLWNADLVPDVRLPVVDPRTGVVFAFMTYCPWGKRGWVDVDGVGRVGPLGDPDRRVALNAMEVFKIDHGQIAEMESVWTIEPGDFRSGWRA